MRGAAELIGTPLPRQEVQAGTPRILAPLDLIAIRAVALHAHLLHPASLPGQLVLGFAAVSPSTTAASRAADMPNATAGAHGTR